MLQVYMLLSHWTSELLTPLQVSECSLAAAFAYGWLACPAGKACKKGPLPLVLHVYTRAPAGLTLPVRPKLLRVVMSLVYEVGD
jgi:hypothetical protein